MLFSQRYGFKPVRQVLQVESMDEPLRNGLWNSYYLWFEDLDFSVRDDLLAALHIDFFHKPVDKYKFSTCKLASTDWFKRLGKWFELYDYLKFCAGYDKEGELSNPCNQILEREMSAYRFIDGKITPITSEVEIETIEQAAQNAEGQFIPVTQHLRTALTLLSDRQQPDYRNSVKESISAVESACKIITNDHKATLSGTLKTLERTGQPHTALKEGFNRLYGYTSDAGGIRHALLENDYTVSFEEAKFMLVTCSAFVNYLRPLASATLL